MIKKGSAIDIVDTNKRVSLAHLVNAQLELKRQSIPQKSFKCYSNNNNNNNKNRLSQTNAIPYNGSRSVSFDMNKTSQNGKRLSQYSERQDRTSKDLFSFLTSTSSLTPKSQIIQVKDNYLTDSKWSFDNGKDTETYGSVINRMAEAVGDSETLFEYIRKASNILYHTPCAKFFTASLVLLHLIQLSIGLKHLNDCPIQQKLPVYIFVGGCVGLLKSLHLIWNQLKISSSGHITSGVEHSMAASSGIDDNELVDNEERNFSKGSKFTDRLLTIFLAIWFGFGNYWILSIYEPRYEPILLEPNNWCDKNLYIFALVHTLIYYVLIALALIFIFLLTIFTQTPYLIMKFQEC